METIDRQWLIDRLTGRRGEQRDLAAAMRIAPDKLTKVLTGARRLQTDEAARAYVYFNAQPAGLAEPAETFAYARVEPVQNRATFLAVARLVAPRVAQPEFWVVNRAAAAAGLLPDDVLVVELGNTALPNDLVLVSLDRPDAEGRQTDVRRYLPPHLVSLDVSDASPVLPINNDGSAAIVATIRACIRSREMAARRA